MIWAMNIIKVGLEGFEEKWIAARTQLDEIYRLRNGTYKQVEEARKRLRHPSLKTTNLEDSIISAIKVQRETKTELAKSLEKTLVLLVADTMADLTLDQLEEAQKDANAKTEAWRDTGLYQGARSAFEYFYTEHQITADHWRHLKHHELDVIAVLVKTVLNRPGSWLNPISLAKGTLQASAD